METWGLKTEKIRQARCACLQAGEITSVMNLVITPCNNYDLPFFGADFVTLPNGHLLALDLQPVLKKDILHTKSVWERLLPLHSRWQSLLPWGGPIPKEAESYFSPGLLWTRLPLGDEADQLIVDVIMPAFRDYLSLYLELVHSAVDVSSDRSDNLLEAQKGYLTYRAEKDPARGMLTRFYGKEWTQSYIHDVLFPF